MEKYNKKLNDDFLLKTNLLDITDYKSLELAEAFVFSLRAAQIEQGTYKFQFINSYADELFYQLNNEPAWTTINQTASRLAYYKSELNMLHPFREGNGRTIRIFVQAYAQSKGVNWNFTNVDKETYLNAMIQSVTNTELLEKLFFYTIEFI
ncbi:Fic family protein [Lysinibacillus sp. NPDC097231]|uniref:Fic family protein n=1 Tax=Lysinibacillus sp. NPDC097231 TaxID=3364142 RepID=UPI003814737B